MKRPNVDTVALVLAIGLAITLVLIMVAVIVNTVTENNPTPTLGENTTQVLTAIVGGAVGVLGSYIGFRSRKED
jgi:hypothetical protein